MQNISKTYQINAPVEKVWQAFVNPEVINQWGGGPAQITETIGEFSLWGGDIFGKNIQVIPQERLVQEWSTYSTSGQKWELPSEVTFLFTSQGDSTRVELSQENIPDEDANSVDSGWDSYFFEPLKAFVEKNLVSIN